MIREQLFLFPEHDHFKQKEKDIDFIYLDEAKDSHFTNKKFSDLPKKRYTLFKTGGVNPYMTDLGPVFPYLYDNFSERIKTLGWKPEITLDEGIKSTLELFIQSYKAGKIREK